jgi:hypothetical protein
MVKPVTEIYLTDFENRTFAGENTKNRDFCAPAPLNSARVYLADINHAPALRKRALVSGHTLSDRRTKTPAGGDHGPEQEPMRGGLEENVRLRPFTFKGFGLAVAGIEHDPGTPVFERLHSRKNRPIAQAHVKNGAARGLRFGQR